MMAALANELIAAFPDCVAADGSLDLAKLTSSLDVGIGALHSANALLDTELERYELTWLTKAQTKQEVRRDAGLTLAPVNGSDSDFAQARNLVIAGDQVTALKVLQRPVLGMGGVKAVYCHLSPDLDQCYATLSLVRPLLRDDGCCFIFCDDAAALAYQRKLCDEVLGSNNFLATLVWQPDERAPLKYILLYARANYDFTIGLLPRTDKANQSYKNPDNDPRGPWKSGDLSVKTYSQSCDYPITTPSGRVVYPPKGGCWRMNQDAFARAVADNRIWFGADGNNVPSIKRFLSELKRDGMVPTSILLPKEMGSLAAMQAEQGAELTITAALAQHLLTLANLTTKADAEPNDVVLLLGECSACAQMATGLTALNLERDAQYRFIWLSSDQGLTWFYDLHRARELTAPALRRLELVSNARAHVAVPLNSYRQDMLWALLETPHHDALAQLYAYLVESGKDLSACIERLELGRYQLLNYDQNHIWFCAEPDIDVELMRTVAACPQEQRPQRLLCSEDSFASDSAKINCCEHAALLLGPDVLTIV